MDSQSEMVGLIVARLDPLMDARVEPIMTALDKITQMLAVQQEMLEKQLTVQPQRSSRNIRSRNDLECQTDNQARPIPSTRTGFASGAESLEGQPMVNQEAEPQMECLEVVSLEGQPMVNQEAKPQMETLEVLSHEGQPMVNQEAEPQMEKWDVLRFEGELMVNTEAEPQMEIMESGKSRVVRSKSGTIEKFSIEVNEAGIPSIVLTTRSSGRSSSFHAVVRSGWFDSVMLGLITLSALVLGAQLQYMVSTGDEHWSTLPANATFTALFVVELLMRLAGEGVRNYLCGPAKAWALLDILAIGIWIGDLVVSNLPEVAYTYPSSLRLIRVLRVLRVVRVIRGVRFLRNLRVLIDGMINSVVAISWTIVAIVFIKFIGAVMVLSLVVERVNDGIPDYEDHWGGLLTSMFTLFQVMTGDGWTEVVDGMKDDFPGVQVFFITYVSITAYGLLNIVTGIFVDQTLTASKSDYELLKESREEATRMTRKFLEDIFDLMDMRHDRKVTEDELTFLLSNHHIAFALAKIDIIPDEAKKMFSILDTDGNGVIDVADFVHGCMQIRRAPTNADILEHGLSTKSMLSQIRSELKELKRYVNGDDGPLSVQV